MKIKIAIAELARVLKQASGVVQGKVTIDVLKYIKLDVNGANATASASDLGMSIIQQFAILASSDGNASILLPARKLQEILMAFSSQIEVTIEKTEKGLTIKAGKYAAVKVPTVPADQFPVIEVRPAPKFSIKLGTLKQLIRRVENAVPSKGSKFVDPIIKLIGTDSILNAVATDGFRIAVAAAPGVGVIDLNLPKAVLPIINSLTGEDVEFSETETKYFFSTPKELLLIQKSVAKFPSYQRAISGVFTTDFTTPSEDFKASIDIVMTTVDESDPRIILETGETNIRVSSSSIEGEAEDILNVILKGAPTRITLNPKFILDYLAQTEGKATICEMSGERGPVKFSVDATYNYFLMPIQPKAATKKE